MPRRRWRPRLGREAEQDLVEILRWTSERFGAGQARTYRRTLLLAIRALAAGPEVAGSTARDDILPGYRVLHVAWRGRRGRHFLIYRSTVAFEIDILRILHDSMDLERHLPGRG